jgi:CRISPR-associated protein Cas2
MKRSLHLVAYDVGDPSRLAATLDVVREFATGGQLSVHECFLSAGELATLRSALAGVVDVRHDAVLVAGISARHRPRVLGRARLPADPSFFFFG